MKRRTLLGTAAALTTLTLPAVAADPLPVIRIGFVEGWADSVATTQVAAAVIRQIGYEVKLTPVAAGLMWQAVARGDLDVTLSAWLPATHATYNGKFKDKVVNLGVNTPDARIGLIVPDYVTIKSVGDLQGQKAAFGGRIVGIDAGAGVMTKTEEAIKAYGLDYTLAPSSGSGMTAELARSIKANKPVAVTGWIPHWMFARWKLKFLDDPKKIYGDAEHVDTVANPSLETKAKPVADFLRRFAWKPGEIDGVMLAIEEGNSPEAAAQKWVAANSERVAQWLAK